MKQMSEAPLTGALLTVAGGFLDAYTYIVRGKVFANAQTGNIVMLAVNIAQKDFYKAASYLVPIAAFVAGVFCSEFVRERFGKKLHWRQWIILAELAVLLIAAFAPQSMNAAVNTAVSFVCALQVNSFRKFHGITCATTMCTGNLRTGSQLIYEYGKTGNKELGKKGIKYFAVDIIFVAGAAAGAALSGFFGNAAVLFCLLPLFFAFCIMFKNND